MNIGVFQHRTSSGLFCSCLEYSSPSLCKDLFLDVVSQRQVQLLLHECRGYSIVQLVWHSLCWHSFPQVMHCNGFLYLGLTVQRLS